VTHNRRAILFDHLIGRRQQQSAERALLRDDLQPGLSQTDRNAGRTPRETPLTAMRSPL
jgi:hypothetical protein